MSNLLKRIFASTGIKRKLSALLQTASLALAVLPGVGGLVSYLSLAANYLGAAAVAHAAGAHLVNQSSLTIAPISTLAALLNALVLAADKIPVLAPYSGLFHALAVVLNPVAAGAVIGKSFDKAE